MMASSRIRKLRPGPSGRRARSREGLVDHLVGEAVRAAPRAAVQLDHDGERSVPTLRPVEPHEQRRVAVTEVLDVLDRDLVAHDGLLADSEVAPRAERTAGKIS